MNDSTPSQCPRCGAALPANAPEGLCPRCLAALPFGTETAFTAEPKRPVQPPLFPEQLAPHFPQLEILECLGRGGMGVVYKARQKSLNRLVALKLLAPERADDPQFAARFEKEAQALAALNHPNIVGVHDFGQAGGFYYLLMEFVDGVNLRQLLQSQRLTPKEALGIVPPVCDALQFAHEHGIVHRDIKPENLLLDKAGRVKIADFGIAKIIAASPVESGAEGKGASAGTATLAVGTPAYAAPEQREANGEADHRADIYSLGVVLYEMLTGERPQKKFELPSRRVQVDVRIDDIVLRALQDTPERRYQTAAEFRTQVETFVHSATAVRASDAEAAAMNAVRAWLVVIDGGAYAASWDEASEWFHRAITKEKWAADVQKVRHPLGEVLSRETLDMELTGGGARFQVRFQTAFAGMPKTVETVLFMRERNGEWKATGYLIRPAETAARLSRLALLGAICALAMFLATPLIFWTAVHDAELQRHDFWRHLLRPLSSVFLLAWIPATILGWVAVRRIRRSPEKLRGMGLAVFAAVFPFLVMVNHSVLSFLEWLVQQGLAAWLHTSTGSLPGWLAQGAFRFSYPFSWSQNLLGLFLLFLDWLILRRVYEAMNRRPEPEPDAPLNKAASVFAWIAGSLTVFAWLVPQMSVSLVAMILIAALDGLLLAAPARHTRRGKWALWACAASLLASTLVVPLVVAKASQRKVQADFGPETECVITGAINLETGAMTPLPLPEPLGERDQKRYDWYNAKPSKDSAFPWMRQHGIDIIDLGNHGLSGIDMFLVTLEPKDWQNLTRAGLEKKMNWQWQGIETPPPDVNFPASNGVYGFKTRSGTWGILQLLSFDLPRGVKVRYKLVVPEPVFNPVEEKTITVGNDAHSFYSFDREDYVPGPRDFDPTDKKNEDRFWKWLTANGVDLFARLRNGHPVLVTSEALRWALDEEDFDRLTPEKLATNEGWRTTLNAQFRGQEASTLDRGRLHGSRDTFIFQNRHEISGLIQVVGVTTNPDGVKVRYRLVPREGVTHAAASPAPASTELDPPSKGQTNISDLSSFYFKHDAADVHYMLFYPHEFGVQDRSSFNTHSLAWLDDGTITLKSGKTLAYLRESVDPLHLRLNGKEFDLRNGRVFLLRDDATVEQHEIPMPLATAQTPDRVAKLVKAALRLDAKSVSSAAPELRFLAWQEKAREPWAHAWHPDGSPVIAPTEIALLKERGILPPGMGDRPDKQGRMVRFLHLWFSHPNFERTSFREVAFFDEDGKPVQGADGSFGSTADEATPETDNLGWVSFSSSPGADADIPARVTVRLRYTVGPLENTQEIKPNFNGGMSLEGGSELSGLGQNAEGRAFVTVAVDTAHSQGRKFGAQAVTKDGRCLNMAGGSSVGGTLGVENFQFPVPLADVATFIVGTRPIRTQEWKDVVLVKPSDTPEATPMPE